MKIAYSWFQKPLTLQSIALHNFFNFFLFHQGKVNRGFTKFFPIAAAQHRIAITFSQCMFEMLRKPKKN